MHQCQHTWEGDRPLAEATLPTDHHTCRAPPDWVIPDSPAPTTTSRHPCPHRSPVYPVTTTLDSLPVLTSQQQRQEDSLPVSISLPVQIWSEPWPKNLFILTIFYEYSTDYTKRICEKWGLITLWCGVWKGIKCWQFCCLFGILCAKYRLRGSVRLRDEQPKLPDAIFHELVRNTEKWTRTTHAQ